VCEPCQWCLKNKNKTLFYKEQHCRNKNRQPHGDKRGKESSECFMCEEEGHRAAVCPQAANFQAMIQKQQGRAYLAAHQATHDAVAYHVMMGQSAAHSSIPPSVSNEHFPAARLALVASLFRALNQLDECAPSRSSPSALPSQPCIPPTPSMPLGTWHPQLPTCVEIDSGASMILTPHASLIRQTQHCNVSIRSVSIRKWLTFQC